MIIIVAIVVAATLILDPNLCSPRRISSSPIYSRQGTGTDTSTMPKHTRPGVEAAVRLTQIREEKVWCAIEEQYMDMLHAKNGEELQSLDLTCEEMGSAWRREYQKNERIPYCTMEQLTTVIRWKFSKGKPRPLWKLINSNTKSSVKDASRKAFSIISLVRKDVTGDDEEEEDSSSNKEEKKNQETSILVKRAIEEFSILKGIGPASATAFLSLYRPDLCIFMDDEVIECLYPGKRGYTVKIYNTINSKCLDLSKDLGECWTARRVGRALWTAARLSLCEDRCDLTSKEKKIDAFSNDEFAVGSSREKMEKKNQRNKTDSNETDANGAENKGSRRSKRLKR